MRDEPIVFERPTPLGVKLLVSLGPVASFLLAPFLILWVEWGVTARLQAALPFGEGTVVGTLAVVLLGVVAWAPAVVCFARRRYGRCELRGPRATLEPALSAHSARQVVSLRDVTTLHPTPSGLLLVVPSRSAWAELLSPLLVPTDDEDDVARVVERVERARGPAPAPPARGLGDAAGPTPRTDAEAVFERPAPRGATCLSVLGVLALGLLAIVALLADVPLPTTLVPPWVAAYGTWLLLLLAAVGLLPVVTAATRRRYGRCAFHGDQAVFELAMERPQRTWIPLALVRRVRPAPGGLLLEVAGRGAWRALAAPLLVPTADEEETARAVALLERAVPPSPDAPERHAVFGRRVPAAISLALFAGVLGVAATAAGLSLSAVGGSLEDAAGVLLWGVWSLLLVAVAIDWMLVRPRYRRVHVGRDALLLDDQRVPWTEVSQVALAPPYLAVSEGDRQWLAHLGADLPRAAERIDERLAASGRELAVERTPPRWAAPAARRQQALVVGAVLALAVAIEVGLAYVVT